MARGGVRAAVVDFESLPGRGALVDGLSIDAQWQASEGVTFVLDNGNDPKLAKVSAPRAAFGGDFGETSTIGSRRAPA